MVDRKRSRRASFLEDTDPDDLILAQRTKTPRRTVEHSAAPLVLRSESSPSKSLTSIAESFGQKTSAILSRMGLVLRVGGRSKRRAHQVQLDGDSSPPLMREVSEPSSKLLSSENGSYPAGDTGEIGQAGPSTRSRTRSRSPKPMTPSTSSTPAQKSQPLPSSSLYPILPSSTVSHDALSPSLNSNQVDSRSSPGISPDDPFGDASDPSARSLSPGSQSQPQSTSGGDAHEPPFESSGSPPEDLEDGTEDQPIDLADTDDEAEEDSHDAAEASTEPMGPISLTPEAGPSTRMRRPPPARPDLLGQSVQRKYDWLTSTDSQSGIQASSRATGSSQPLSPSQKSGVRSSRSRRKGQRDRQGTFKRYLKSFARNQHKAGIFDGNTKRAFYRLVHKPEPRDETQGRVLEWRFQRDSKLFSTSKEEKDAYTDLLLKNNLKTVEDITQKPIEPTFSPGRSRRIANRAQLDAAQRRNPAIDEILESFQKQRLEDEQAIQKRLRPRVPTQMAPGRLETVNSHWKNPAFKVEHLNAEVRSASLQRLKDRQWLDDEIINYYGSLIQARSDRSPKSDEKAALPNIHFFNSFFYQKLSEQGYAASRLKRWTKKFDLFSKDLVIFPINQGNMHWTAGAINFQKKRLEYFDSLSQYPGQGEPVFENLFQYLQEEHKDKKGTDFDDSDWKKVFNINTPQQNNGSDCGVFSSQTLELLSRGKDLSKPEEFDFTCEHMPYLRRLMVWEIAEGKLEPRWPKEG